MPKYHINPEHEMGECRTTVGRCPYGGESGEENHFTDPVEAAKESSRRLMEEHGLFTVAKKFEVEDSSPTRMESRRRAEEEWIANVRMELQNSPLDSNDPANYTLDWENPYGTSLSTMLERSGQDSFLKNGQVYHIEDYSYERGLLSYLVKTKEEEEEVWIEDDDRENIQFMDSVPTTPPVEKYRTPYVEESPGDLERILKEGDSFAYDGEVYRVKRVDFSQIEDDVYGGRPIKLYEIQTQEDETLTIYKSSFDKIKFFSLEDEEGDFQKDW